MKIYVGNLSFDTTDETLHTLFGEHGLVDSATVLTEPDTGRSRGFGFVDMSEDEEAQAAIQALDGLLVDGRRLRVNEARPRDPQGWGNSRRSGGFAAGGRGGGQAGPRKPGQRW